VAVIELRVKLVRIDFNANDLRRRLENSFTKVFGGYRSFGKYLFASIGCRCDRNSHIDRADIAECRYPVSATLLRQAYHQIGIDKLIQLLVQHRFQRRASTRDERFSDSRQRQPILIALAFLNRCTQHAHQHLSPQPTFHQPPEHRTTIRHGSEIREVRLSRTPEWTVSLRNRRIGQTLTIQLGLHRIWSKLLLEKLRRQVSHERVAQHAASFAANRRLSSDPQVRYGFCNGKRSGSVNFRNTYGIGVDQDRPAVAESGAASNSNQAHRHVRRWTKRGGVKGARRSRESNQRLSSFAIVRRCTLLQKRADASPVASAFDFVPIALD